MGDSVKEKIIDKAIDQLISFVSNKTKDQLIEELTKDDFIKILFNTMKDFSNCDYFKNEFSSYIFDDDNGNYIICNVNSEDINPSFPMEVLKEKLSKIVNRYFISDLNDNKELLVKHITLKYVRNASFKIKLFDLLVQQQNYFQQVLSELDMTSKLLLDIKENVDHDKQFKRTLLNTTLRENIAKSVTFISDYYLAFVQKMPVEIKCNKNPRAILPYAEAIEHTIRNMDTFVNADFKKKPIHILVRDQNSIDHFYKTNSLLEKDIDYAEFCEFHFKSYIINEIRKIFESYHTFLTDELVSDLFELEKYMCNDIFATGLNLGIRVDQSKIPADVEQLKTVLIKIGEIILKLIHKLK